MVGILSIFGRWVCDRVDNWGRAWIFLFAVLRAGITTPYRPFLIINQISQIGVNSTLVIALIGLFTGAVLAVQAEYTLTKFGATAFTGSAIALSLIRELGPVLTALMVIGRAGSAMTAELGIMKISEQIDALRSMAVDPNRYLMAPRIIASTISVPFLTAIFIVVGIFGGFLVSVGLLDLNSGTFWSQMNAAVSDVDVYGGILKSVVFGFIFGWICAFKGSTCGFGALGVNRATTQAVVTASVAVLVLDYFLTSILTRIFLD
jgi:phospholipid/cholesterol/gamma-HCH transport system permease protein